MDFSNSVILPREDFIELSTVAWNQPPTTVGERIGTTVQTTLFFTAMTAAFSVGTYAWYRLMSKLEKEKTANAIYEAETIENIRNKK